MLVSVASSIVCSLLDRLGVRTPSTRTQTVERLALRHEVRVRRRLAQPTAWRPGDRRFLTVLSHCLPRAEWWRLPVRPETLLRWPRELVRRKWAAFSRQRGHGRPALAPELCALLLRLVQENPTWGDIRLRGERLKGGHPVEASTIQARLRRHRVPPAPTRAGLSWPVFLRAHAAGVLAGDRFTVESVRLQTLYVRFFLEGQTRRVFLAALTS